MRSVITGTGMAVPDTVVTNDDLSRIMDTDDDWIYSRTGVHERRLVGPGVGSSDLAVIAGRAAIGALTDQDSVATTGAGRSSRTLERNSPPPVPRSTTECRPRADSRTSRS